MVSMFLTAVFLFRQPPALFLTRLAINRPSPLLRIVELWETSEAGARLKYVEPEARATPPVKQPDLVLKLRPDEERQTIVGFGGAITQASGTVWRRLKSELLRQRVVDLYFGASGIDASLARVPINSCDFSEASYSLDDVYGDVGLESFDESLERDEALMLPLVRRALAAGGTRLRLLASPWSPPGWMKSNGAMNGNGAPRGLRPEAAPIWAAYISRWLAAWSAHGANVSMLTVQNEPMAPSPWEACYYDVAQEAGFISDHLGPQLAKGALEGLHPAVELFGSDDQKDTIEDWSRTLLADGAPAATFTNGIAYHWYAGDHFKSLAAATAAHPTKVCSREHAAPHTRRRVSATCEEWYADGMHV